MAAPAEQQKQLRQRLTEVAPPIPPEVEEAWQASPEECESVSQKEKPGWGETIEEQCNVLVAWRDEK